MNDHQKEAFSALFDGEVDEFELRRLLAVMDEDALLKWRRYQLIHDAARHAIGNNYFTVGNMTTITSLIPDGSVVAPQTTEKTTGSHDNKRKESYLKPVAGFAIAASIAFVTVMGIQNLSVEQPGLPAGFIADGNVSASQLPITGSIGLNQVSGTSPVLLASEVEHNEAQKEQPQGHLEYYLQQHAENASFNNGQGFLPMARLVSEDY